MALAEFRGDVGFFWLASTNFVCGFFSVFCDQARHELKEPRTMMSQETYMKMTDLYAQGWTITEIAKEAGVHPATVSKYLKHGPPSLRVSPSPVMTPHWCERIEVMITEFPRLQGVSVFNKLRAEGFAGGYSTVTDVLRDMRGPRFRAADAVSVPIHTGSSDLGGVG